MKTRWTGKDWKKGTQSGRDLENWKWMRIWKKAKKIIWSIMEMNKSSVSLQWNWVLKTGWWVRHTWLLTSTAICNSYRRVGKSVKNWAPGLQWLAHTMSQNVKGIWIKVERLIMHSDGILDMQPRTNGPWKEKLSTKEQRSDNKWFSQRESESNKSRG